MGPQVFLPTGAGLFLEQVSVGGEIVHLSVHASVWRSLTRRVPFEPSPAVVGQVSGIVVVLATGSSALMRVPSPLMGYRLASRSKPP